MGDCKIRGDGVGAAGAGDNLGDHTATQNLDMATFDVINVGELEGDLDYSSDVVDGATAIGHDFDTQNALSTDGAKIAAYSTNNVEKLAIDKDGNILTAGGNSEWVVRPSEGDVGIQAAINAASAAGGGIVQLLAGTYTISAIVTMPSDANDVTIQGKGKSTIIDVQSPGSGGLPTWGFDFEIAQVGALDSKVITATARNDTSVTFSTIAEAAAFLDGDNLLISGTDADGEFWRELNEAAANGDGGAGTLSLKTPIRHALTTTVTITGFRFGRNIVVKDMAFIHGGGQAHAIRFNRGWNHVLENCSFDGSDFSENYACLFTVYRSIIRSNLFQHYNRPETGSLGVGIFVTRAIETKFERNVVLNCGNATKANRSGIEVRDAFESSFSENIVTGTKGDGIRLFNSFFQRHIVIEENIVSGSSDVGINIIGVSNNSDITVNGNICNSNGLDGTGQGIVCTATRVTIDGNTCNLNSDTGIRSIGSLQISITDNNCRNNGFAGVSVTISSAGVAVTGNVVEDNTFPGIDVDSSSDVIVAGNYATGNGQRGIEVDGTANEVIISNNISRGNTGGSLFVDSTTSNVSILGNNFRGDAVTIVAGATGLRFANNTSLGRNAERSSTAVSVSSASEEIIGVTDTSVARTITLSTADLLDGRRISIKDESGAAGTNNITIATQGAETIDGAATIAITANFGVARIYSDGTNWFSE